MNSAFEHAWALLERAKDDLYVLRHLQPDAEAPGWVLGFHAQQAVEKALKAVLSGAGQAYPRTHNLVMLVELLRTVGIEAPPDADAFANLTPYGVVLRYEDVFVDEPPTADLAGFVPLVTRTLDWAQARLQP